MGIPILVVILRPNAIHIATGKILFTGLSVQHHLVVIGVIVLASSCTINLLRSSLPRSANQYPIDASDTGAALCCSATEIGKRSINHVLEPGTVN